MFSMYLIGYLGDGYVVCPSCGREELEQKARELGYTEGTEKWVNSHAREIEDLADLRPIYDIEWQDDGEGLACDNCTETIIEPAEPDHDDEPEEEDEEEDEEELSR